MTAKTKLSHFTANDQSKIKTTGNRYADRSLLARLYPKAKSYEERLRDDKWREQSYRRRWPKYPYLNVAVYGSVAVGLSIWFGQSVSSWWFSSDDGGIIMGIVFFTFAIGMGLVFLFIAWGNYANRLLSQFGGMARLFWLVYSFLIMSMLVLWLSDWVGHYTDILWVPALTAVHFVVVLLSTRLIMRRGL